MKWLVKARKQVIADWKANTLTWAQALARLVDLGYSDEDAATILAKQ